MIGVWDLPTVGGLEKSLSFTPSAFCLDEALDFEAGE